MFHQACSPKKSLFIGNTSRSYANKTQLYRKNDHLKHSSSSYLIYHPQFCKLLSVRYLYFHFTVYVKCCSPASLQINFWVLFSFGKNETHKHKMIESSSYQTHIYMLKYRLSFPNGFFRFMAILLFANVGMYPITDSLGKVNTKANINSNIERQIIQFKVISLWKPLYKCLLKLAGFCSCFLLLCRNKR